MSIPSSRHPCALLLALALPLLAGCESGLGLGTGTQCAAEKQNVRRQHGQPDRVDQGIRSEFWFYNDERITYEFSWDQTGESCSVQTRRFTRLPGENPIAPNLHRP